MDLEASDEPTVNFTVLVDDSNSNTTSEDNTRSTSRNGPSPNQAPKERSLVRVHRSPHQAFQLREGFSLGISRGFYNIGIVFSYSLLHSKISGLWCGF